MLDRQRTRREPDAVRVEDVIPAEILGDVGDADRAYLEQVFREPQKYLPPRRQSSATAEAGAEDSGDEPENRFARRAKLAGLAMAGGLVATAVVVAPTLTAAHRPVTVTEATAPAGFSGAAALGGRAVPHQQQQHNAADGGTTAGQQDTTGHGKQPASSSAPAPGQSSVTPSSSAAPTSSATTSAPKTPGDKLAAVKNFYATIGRDANGALALLAPALAGGEPGDLVRAWSTMDAIDVQEKDTQVQPDGSVLAVVTMRQPDGGLLRVTQLLRFAENTAALITDARLLSAQYM
ncbi:hypothetical protein ACFWY9_00880 [Amycolatopsis sp. NPDC059027]|uniref:hypothetical protein n=1 Tax=unclassified Amycolatopsis TaxID=2618356 RepID=UPI00366D11B4